MTMISEGENHWCFSQNWFKLTDDLGRADGYVCRGDLCTVSQCEVLHTYQIHRQNNGGKELVCSDCSGLFFLFAQFLWKHKSYGCCEFEMYHSDEDVKRRYFNF